MKAQLGEFTVFRMVTEPDRDPEHMKALVKMMDMLTNDQVTSSTPLDSFTTYTCPRAAT